MSKKAKKESISWMVSYDITKDSFFRLYMKREKIAKLVRKIMVYSKAIFTNQLSEYDVCIFRCEKLIDILTKKRPMSEFSNDAETIKAFNDFFKKYLFDNNLYDLTDQIISSKNNTFYDGRDAIRFIKNIRKLAKLTMPELAIIEFTSFEKNASILDYYNQGFINHVLMPIYEVELIGKIISIHYADEKEENINE